MFAITAFFHRYFAHRAFKTSRIAQFVFAFWGGLAVQRGALWWAAHHRHHHKVSDESGDVHSPRMDGFIWSHIGWITADCNMPTRYELIGDLTRYPELVFLNRFDWIPGLEFRIFLALFRHFSRKLLPSVGTSGLEMALWGFFVSTVILFHGVCSINSFAHIFGKRRYNVKDDSKNNIWLALITLGEGWHNNHHRFPGTARQGSTGGKSILPIIFCASLASLLGLGLTSSACRRPMRARTVPMSSEKKSLAIVGSGIAGLGCAYHLREHYRITVFDANDYVGGHTNTIELESKLAFDTGFMVFNYETLSAFDGTLQRALCTGKKD